MPTWSDGSGFAGTLSFSSPYNNDGGLFALSSGNIIVNPSGSGVAALGNTVQQATVTATDTIGLYFASPVSGSTLRTNGVLCTVSPPCSYTITVTATPSGSIAPFTKTFTITATPVLPPPVTLSLTFNPLTPSIPSDAALGSYVTTAVPTWSDGRQFKGSLIFAAPYNNDGGVFTLTGPPPSSGLSPNGSQISPGSSVSPIRTSDGSWSFGALDPDGINAPVLLNGASQGFHGRILGISGGQLYLRGLTVWWLWQNGQFVETTQPASILDGAGANVIINPSGPGVAALGNTTQNATVTATDAVQNIVSVVLSPTSFAGGSADGTLVGNITVTMDSSPPFSGTLTVVGGNTNLFRISGSTLVTAGVVPAGNYSITLTATPTNGATLPFTTSPIAITGIAQTITGITVSGTHSFTAPGAPGTQIGTISVTMDRAPAFSGTLTQNNASFTITNCVNSVCELRIGGSTLAAGNYSTTITATPADTSIAPFSTTVSVVGSGAAGSAITTYTVLNNSATPSPAGAVYIAGQAFRRGDFPPGSYPLFQDAGTHAPLVQQLDEIATRRENGDDGSIRHLSFSVQLPAIAANGTYTMEIVKQTGTYTTPAGKQTLAGLCAAHDLKLDLTDVRNQNATVRDSGHMVSRLCDNINNTGRDTPRRVAQGPVRDSWIVRGVPVYATSGNKDPQMYVEWIVDITTDPSNQTSLGPVRHVAIVSNPWMRVSSSSTGNPGAPGPIGFTNDPQAISYRPQVLDGSTNILDWSWYDADLDSASNPIITNGLTPPDCFYHVEPGYNGNIIVPSSVGENQWYYGMATNFHSTGTPPSGLANDKLYHVNPNTAERQASDPNGTQQIRLAPTPRLCANGVPDYHPSTQGTGIHQFRFRVWHTKWTGWYTWKQDAKENWTSGSTSRFVSNLYPKFTTAQQLYWKETGAVLPFKPKPGEVAAWPYGINFGQGNIPYYGPLGAGNVMGGGSTGGEHEYLGTTSDFVAYAINIEDPHQWDMLALQSAASIGAPQGYVLDEVTGRFPMLNNGPPAANHGGSGVPYVENGVTLPIYPNTFDYIPNGNIAPGSFAAPLENVPDASYSGYKYGAQPNNGSGDHAPSSTNGPYQFLGSRSALQSVYAQATHMALSSTLGNAVVLRQAATINGVTYYGVHNACCQVRGAYWHHRDKMMAAAFGSDSNIERKYFNDILVENHWEWVAVRNFINGGITGNYNSLFTTQYSELNPSTFKNVYGHVTLAQAWALLRDPLSGLLIPHFVQEHMTRCSDTVAGSYSSYYCGMFNWIINAIDSSQLSSGGAIFGTYAPNTGQYYDTSPASMGDAIEYWSVNNGNGYGSGGSGVITSSWPYNYVANGDKVRNPNTLNHADDGLMGLAPDEMSSRTTWYEWMNVVTDANGFFVSGQIKNPATGQPFPQFTYGGVEAPHIFYLAHRPTISFPTGAYSNYSSYAVAAIKMLYDIGHTELQPALNKMVIQRGITTDDFWPKLRFDETVVIR